MAAVLEYTNKTGYRNQRAWKPNDERRFTALIKCYVQSPGKKELQVIEKPSTRPATFEECCKFAGNLKKQYGDTLKQLIVWDLDELNAITSSIEGGCFK